LRKRRAQDTIYVKMLGTELLAARKATRVNIVPKNNDQSSEAQRKADQATTQAAQEQLQEQAKPADPKATVECRPLKYNEQGESVRYVRQENESPNDGE
jgi:hypothetical protein